uniref:Fibronectin type-III domain-containing protein n=1 Tax=Branchiostoma floridae TaxID=7739 RepID=C3YH43_BRAFL|eukprot:XP_002604268.1 hypothetical protein BRAFLDRAFT_88557 [Branchiostoma floridae]
MVLRTFHTFWVILGALFVRNCGGEPQSQPVVSVTVTEVTTSSAVLSWDSHSRDVTKCSLIYWEDRAGQRPEVNLVEVDLERNGTFQLTRLDRNCSYRAQFKCFVGDNKYVESEKILFTTASNEDVVSTFMPHSNSKPPITKQNTSEDNGSTPSLSRYNYNLQGSWSSFTTDMKGKNDWNPAGLCDFRYKLHTLYKLL